MKHFIFPLTIGFIIHGAMLGFSMTTHCTMPNEKLKLFHDDGFVEIDFSIKDAFTMSGLKLGNGNFGFVRSVTTDGKHQLPSWLNGPIAVKEIDLAKDPKVSAARMKPLLKNELETLYNLRNESFVPKIFACVGKGNFYYVAQEKLLGSLDNFKLMEQMRNFYHWSIMKRFVPLFRGLKRMEELNVVFNDIKPANIMAGEENLNDLRFIDFGFANKLDSEESVRHGSSRYLSPNRQKGSKHSIIDELYALVISIARILDEKGILFKDRITSKNKKVFDINDKCFDVSRTEACKLALMENVKEIFNNSGFGIFKDTKIINEMNGTTLFVKVVEFQDINIKTSYDMILAQLEVLNKQYSQDRLAWEKEQKEKEQLEPQVTEKVEPEIQEIKPLPKPTHLSLNPLQAIKPVKEEIEVAEDKKGLVDRLTSEALKKFDNRHKKSEDVLKNLVNKIKEVRQHEKKNEKVLNENVAGLLKPAGMNNAKVSHKSQELNYKIRGMTTAKTEVVEKKEEVENPKAPITNPKQEVPAATQRQNFKHKFMRKPDTTELPIEKKEEVENPKAPITNPKKEVPAGTQKQNLKERFMRQSDTTRLPTKLIKAKLDPIPTDINQFLKKETQAKEKIIPDPDPELKYLKPITARDKQTGKIVEHNILPRGRNNKLMSLDTEFNDINANGKVGVARNNQGRFKRYSTSSKVPAFDGERAYLHKGPNDQSETNLFKPKGKRDLINQIPGLEIIAEHNSSIQERAKGSRLLI